VYVGLALRQRASGDGTSIHRVWTLWDLDDLDSHPPLMRCPSPAIVNRVRQPTHLPAYWPTTEPVTSRATVAAQLDADTGAVTNAATILRSPGTYS
jgi:hypothetical protein